MCIKLIAMPQLVCSRMNEKDHEPRKSNLVVEKFSAICYDGTDGKNCIYFNVLLILILFICSVGIFVVFIHVILI